MAAGPQGSRFHEEQTFPAWVKVVVLVPVVVVGAGTATAWIEGSAGAAAGLTVLALVFAVFALPNFLLRLVTSVDAAHLRLRIEPLGLPVPLLPPRVRDVGLEDVDACEARTYRTLSGSEYWGRHWWGLSTGRGGRNHMYVMRGRALSARGVEVELRSGEKLLIGSARPEELAAAINRSA